MYCAIDEAGSHVGSKSFRLVVGVYSQTGEDLLGSACSQPIRVMANNDIPKALHMTTGPADLHSLSLPLDSAQHMHIRSSCCYWLHAIIETLILLTCPQE